MTTATLSGGSHGGETADFDETQAPARVRLLLRPGRLEVYELRPVLDEFGLPLEGQYCGVYTGVEAG